MATYVHGSYRVPFPRDIVWAALFDPAVIRSAIPGCRRLVQHSPTHFEADIAVSIGPFSTVFTGTVAVEQPIAPQSCTLVGQGQGGIAGFFQGSSKVTFEEVAGKTTVSYSVMAQTGGKLAFIGDLIINTFAQRFSDAFFEGFYWGIVAQQTEKRPTATWDENRLEYTASRIR